MEKRGKNGRKEGTRPISEVKIEKTRRVKRRVGEKM